MKLILIKYVRKLGQIGDLVTVADGFGRNYLIPQQFAIAATNANIKLFEQQKDSITSKNLEEKNNAELLSSTVLGSELTFIKQAADDGRLFGSVNKKEIALELSKALRAKNALEKDFLDSDIVLEAPIKYVGAYKVSVSLHAEVSTTIIVIIAKSASEAAKALVVYRNSQIEKTTNAAEEEIPE